MSYKLHAKNKLTGDIEEFEVIPNNDYKKIGTNNVLDSRVFKMEYESVEEEKTSNCCDAFVNPDLMICSDCKEPCGYGEDNAPGSNWTQ